MPERIQIVDEHDQLIGTSTRQEAWAKGSYHRLVQIVLRDEEDNFLLQKRSPNRPLYPGCWTNAASGHVDEGESYEAAAPRELIEEIGLKVPLTFKGKIVVKKVLGSKRINQFHAVFEGRIAHTTQFTLQPEEVSEVRWFAPEELRAGIAKNPEAFTPAVVKAIEEFYQ